jgi:hypothetical protein
MEKGGESGLINFPHPPTLLQTNTIHVIGCVDATCKKEVETPSAFKLFLVGVTGVSADFTPVNITPTTNQVFPTLSHQYTLLTVVTQLGVNLIV